MNVNSDIFSVAFCQALNTEYSSESVLCVCVCVCVFLVFLDICMDTHQQTRDTPPTGDIFIFKCIAKAFLHHYQVPHSRIVLL